MACLKEFFTIVIAAQNERDIIL